MYVKFVCVSAGFWGLVQDCINDFQIKQYSVPLSIIVLLTTHAPCPNIFPEKKKKKLQETFL